MDRTDGPVYGRGVVQRGRLRIEASNVFAAELALLRDGVVEIRIERKRATRSQQANRYWWGVCVALVADHTGYTRDEIHEMAKQMFLPKRLILASPDGARRGDAIIGGSTARLNLVEFGAFIERFRAWAEETLGVVIPEPEGAPLVARACEPVADVLAEANPGSLAALEAEALISVPRSSPPRRWHAPVASGTGGRAGAEMSARSQD